MDTPWGNASEVRPVGEDGLLWVSTASHGGYYVPDRLLAKISAEGRDYACRSSESANWYEEDAAWAYVALAFPNLFSKQAMVDAGYALGFIHKRRA